METVIAKSRNYFRKQAPYTFRHFRNFYLLIKNHELGTNHRSILAHHSRDRIAQICRLTPVLLNLLQGKEKSGAFLQGI